MKNRILSLFLFVTLLPGSVHAATGRAQEILQGVAAHVRSLGNYEVEFLVEAGAQPIEGFYAVGGDCYYIRLGAAEVYGDRKTRYEVNNQAKEIVVDKMNTENRSVLNNPTKAFDLMGDEFVAELLWERDGQSAVRLTPKRAESGMSAITVTVDTRRMEPRSLTYDFDGDRIAIGVQRMTGGKGVPKSFGREAYQTYEFIDFR